MTLIVDWSELRIDAVRRSVLEGINVSSCDLIVQYFFKHIDAIVIAKYLRVIFKSSIKYILMAKYLLPKDTYEYYMCTYLSGLCSILIYDAPSVVMINFIIELPINDQIDTFPVNFRALPGRKLTIIYG